MKRSLWPLTIAVLLLLPAWADPHGTAPRSDASQYPAHAEQAGTVNIGARLLTRKEVRKTFVSNLNRCCVVIELAVFPQNGKPFSVSLNDISVRIDGAQTADKPVSATVVSAALQKKANHDHDITISPVTEVGYETGGYDDPTRVGDRSHGVYTAAGVGIGIGKSSGASDQDRSDMKTELSEKGLPEGSITAPVAGFVYFEIPPKNKNTHYQMKYAVNGTSITLALQ